MADPSYESSASRCASGISGTNAIGLISCSFAIASIVGGWAYVFAIEDGRLFMEGGWQWFNAHFPFRTVRSIAAVAIVMGLTPIVIRRRLFLPLPLLGVLLGTFALVKRWHW